MPQRFELGSCNQFVQSRTQWTDDTDTFVAWTEMEALKQRSAVVVVFYAAGTTERVAGETDGGPTRLTRSTFAGKRTVRGEGLHEVRDTRLA